MAKSDTEKLNEKAEKADTPTNDSGEPLPVTPTPAADELPNKSDKEERGLTGAVPAEIRARVPGSAPTKNGLMDNMSRRSIHDALEGHFVNIDLNDSDVQQAYKDAGLEGHTGDYGVYVQPGDCDPETGIPVTAQVRLRDGTNARVVVPYEALRPAEARGR